MFVGLSFPWKPNAKLASIKYDTANVNVSVDNTASPVSIILGTFAENVPLRLSLLCLLHKALFQESFTFGDELYLFCEIVISNSASRAIKHMCGPIESYLLGTAARNGNSQTFPLNFQREFPHI
jgi:hypothetical protein